MEFIVENWPVLVAAVAIIAVAIAAIVIFFTSGKQEQIEKVKEWLLYATTLAEKELGGGTGKLKLRSVYDMFVVKFPWLVRVISFDYFSELVDEALVEMRNLLDTNENVKDYVENSKWDLVADEATIS